MRFAADSKTVPKLLSLITHHSSLLFSAGDLSGDIHSARLAREVLQRHADWTIHALGGAYLREAGARILHDTTGYGVIGVASALKLLPGIPRVKKQILQLLQTEKITAAVLCDWGAFNVRLLPLLREFEIPVLYYFPPRSWQQTGTQGLEFARLTDRIATPFPWSAERINNAGGNAEWVGHPLLEIVEDARAKYSREETRRALGASESDKLIAILPGSREMELNVLSPHLRGAIELLQQEYSGARFVVAAPAGHGEKVRRRFPNVPIAENRAAKVLLACDAAIVKSGTSTLEAAVCGAPQIVIYDVPLAVHAQIRLLGLHKKVKFVSMPNIILQRSAVPELLGTRCRAAHIAHSLSTLLDDKAQSAAQRAAYREVRNALGETLPYTATQRTADMLDEMIAGGASNT